METAALFAYGTLWFWLLIVVASIILFACTEFERGALATVTVVVAILVVHIWGGKILLTKVAEHPWRTLEYAGIYLVIGTLWGISKWYSFVRRARRKFDEALDLFREHWKLPGTVDSYRSRTHRHDMGTKDLRSEEEVFKDAWKSVVSDGAYRTISFEYKPDPKKHKERILIWMTYWPWSFLWTMLNDPFKAAYHRILGLLKRISEGAFRDVDDSLQSSTAKKP